MINSKINSNLKGRGEKSDYKNNKEMSIIIKGQ